MAVLFQDKLQDLGIVLNEGQIRQFEAYYQFLIAENKVMNLTTIVEKEEVYAKHFYDSISLAGAFRFSNQSILDVGSGAGFPAIPLKLVFPELKITIIDSLQKRIDFLDRLSLNLHISDLELVHGRVEEFRRKGEFDIVVARALARMNLLLELCLPFVKTGGYFVAMKSLHYQEELDEAKNATEILGGKLDRVFTYEIEPGLSHVLILIQKIKATPAIYPRTFAQIKKRPL